MEPTPNRQERYNAKQIPALSYDLDQLFERFVKGDVAEPSFTEGMCHLESHVPEFLGSQHARETLDEARCLKQSKLKDDPLEVDDIAVVREWSKDRAISLYRQITTRTFQRSSPNVSMEPIVPIEFKLMSALMRAPSTGSLNVSRVINADLASKYKEGDYVQFWAPTSTTLASDSEILAKFGGDGPIAIFHLKLLTSGKGREIQQYSQFPDEQEVLLLPGVKFRVSAVFSKNGITWITATEIHTLSQPVSATVPASANIAADLPLIGKGFYFIKPRHSNRFLDCDGGGNGANIQLWDKGPQDNKQFTFQPSGGGYFFIKPKHSNHFFDCGGGGNGAKIQLWDKGPQDNKQFTFQPAGGGYFFIKPKHSNRVLDCDLCGGGNGAKIQLWDKDSGEDNKQFMLVPV